ncbi:MAG: hypothetical protein E5X65_20655 [Mesorhizobium sp.]|nr:MAG: hypothetical protein E5X65_20655 [Mesorhizobium sp.]
MKRYLVYPTQFDTRAHMLDEAAEHWDMQVKDLHAQNKERLVANLKDELGDFGFEQKIKNFRDLGSSPFSIVAHHNALFHQARYAFIHSLYYPALTAGCALGERILNHLLLDLRHHFSQSPFDRRSHTRQSIDDWSKAIETLSEWGVFQTSKVKTTFEQLKALRNRSLHFNASTIATLREDALAALGCLATVIEKQFGFQFERTIPGSKGAFFFRKDAEADPFIRHYYLRHSPHVSPYYAMNFVGGVWLVFDRVVGPDVEVSDEEFVSIFRARTPDQLAPTDVPWSGEVAVVALTPAGVMAVDYRPGAEALTDRLPSI